MHLAAGLMCAHSVDLQGREEAVSLATKLLVNGYITQITGRDKIDDEDTMLRFERVTLPAKKVRTSYTNVDQAIEVNLSCW